MTHCEFRPVVPPRRNRPDRRSFRPCPTLPLESPARHGRHGKKTFFPADREPVHEKNDAGTGCVRQKRSGTQKGSPEPSAAENCFFVLSAPRQNKILSKTMVNPSLSRSCVLGNAARPLPTAFSLPPRPEHAAHAKRRRKTRRFIARQARIPASPVPQNGRSVRAVRHFPSTIDDSRPKAPVVPLPAGQAGSPVWHSVRRSAPPKFRLPPGRTRAACAWGHAPSEAIPAGLRFSNRFLIPHRYWADFRSAHKSRATPCLCRVPSKMSPAICCLAPTLCVLRVCS